MGTYGSAARYPVERNSFDRVIPGSGKRTAIRALVVFLVLAGVYALWHNSPQARAKRECVAEVEWGAQGHFASCYSDRTGGLHPPEGPWATGATTQKADR